MRRELGLRTALAARCCDRGLRRGRVGVWSVIGKMRPTGPRGAGIGVLCVWLGDAGIRCGLGTLGHAAVVVMG